MKNEKTGIFNSILETFENEEIKDLAVKMIDDIPDYFYDIGASSTGKYHAAYCLGNLGLARHTVALVRFMNHMFAIEQTKNEFGSRERDLLRLSGIMHDSRKSGEEGNKSKFTVFDHPLLSANAIRRFKGINNVKDEEIELMARCCESHMGEFNTSKRSKVILPKPQDKYEKFVHMCDYLASRKDIEVLFDDFKSTPVEKPDINTYKLGFGKHKGKLITEIAKDHKDYLVWMKEDEKFVLQEPLKSFVNELLK